TVIDQRARSLRAALDVLSLAPSEPELQLLHRCFDNWRGIGDVVAGMARQEYDLEFRRYGARVGARSSSRAVLSIRSRHMPVRRGQGARAKRCSARLRMRYASPTFRMTPRRVTGPRLMTHQNDVAAV